MLKNLGERLKKKKTNLHREFWFEKKTLNLFLVSMIILAYLVKLLALPARTCANTYFVTHLCHVLKYF